MRADFVIFLYGGYFPGYITNFRATIGDAKYWIGSLFNIRYCLFNLNNIFTL